MSRKNENTETYEINEDQLELILDHLDIDNIDEFTQQLRKYRITKEYDIFGKADLYF